MYLMTAKQSSTQLCLIRLVLKEEEKGRINYVNLMESEIQIMVEAKICGCNTKPKEHFLSFYRIFSSLCLDKREIILAQIQACERLLKYTKDDTEASVIKSEIVDLTLF